MRVPDIIKETARVLRKSMTPAEKYLWECLKSGKLERKNFLKQKPIFVYEEDSGLARYIIADFVCLENKLIIELDGSIHNIPEVLQLDKHKEELLENLGFKILRLKNEEVLNETPKVLEKIAASFL